MPTSSPRRGATIQPHPALRGYILLISILVAFWEAAAQQLRPYQPPEMLGFSAITVS
jgi:hypothetical protein